MNNTWFRRQKRKVERHELLKLLECVTSKPHTLVIGTDSQPVREGEVFVTVVCVLCPEHPKFDRCFFYNRELRTQKSHTLYDRMLAETMQTINVANDLRNNLGAGTNFELHFDLASSPKGQTFRFAQGLTSIAKGYAFDNICTKPESWAASSIADKYSKASRRLRFCAS